MIHINSKQAVKQFSDWYDKRNNDEIKTLDTGIEKLNNVFESGNGLEWNVVWTICGLSGHGKTTFQLMIEDNILSCNKNQNFHVLSFLLETKVRKAIQKKLMKRTNMTARELFSKKQKDISYDSQVNELTNQPVTYTEEGLEDDIYSDTIRNEIIKKYEEINKNVKEGDEPIGLLVSIDHSLLVENKTGEDERTMLKNMSKMLAKLTNKIKCTVILLSQLNDNILADRRINSDTGAGHYPQMNDLFGGRSLFHASDYVSVVHRPEKLNIPLYGPSSIDPKDLTFLHFIKVREGEECIIKMKNDLSRSKFIIE